MDTITNPIIYRLLTCPYCSYIFGWIEERMPTCCPECGRHIYGSTRIAFIDQVAKLTYHRKA
jgi:hypothetical protein